MGLKEIKVFPDHCSSGLWDAETGKNIDIEEFEGVLNTSDLMALKYWHTIWELFIAEALCSARYVELWNKDGQDLVDCFNEKQGVYKFVYMEEE